MTTKTKTSARRTLSPRASIRSRFEQSGPEAAIKFGVKTFKKLPEATIKRYVAYFQSAAGKAEARKAAKRAAKKAA